MRRSPRTIGAVAVSLATAGASIVALSGSAGATASAKSQYDAAIKTAGSQGVHFDSTASEQGVTIKVAGDTGATSGTLSLSVHKGTLSEKADVTLVNATGYVRGNPTALVNILGLTAAQAAAYANKWLSFPTNNATLAELITGLRNKDVATELNMSGPFTLGGTKNINGQATQAIKGSVRTSTGTTVPVVLYVETGGTPRPIEEITNPKKSGTAITGTVIFSKWGEKTHPKAPAHATSLISLAPAG